MIERIELEQWGASPTINFNRAQTRCASTSISDEVGVTGAAPERPFTTDMRNPKNPPSKPPTLELD